MKPQPNAIDKKSVELLATYTILFSGLETTFMPNRKGSSEQPSRQMESSTRSLCAMSCDGTMGDRFFGGLCGVTETVGTAGSLWSTPDGAYWHD
jgi:hypothetical protein